MKRINSLWVVAVAGTLGGAALGLSAAGQTTQSNQDTMAALLVEVRGLRVAIEQMASTGPRIQLAFGRLQMQEQRVNTVVRRADSLRDATAAAEKEIAPIRERLVRFQNLLETSASPEQRVDLEAQIGFDKRALAPLLAEVQRLQAEETVALSQVSAEQGRWADINQRLEELERAISRR